MHQQHPPPPQHHLMDAYQRTMYSSTPSKSLTTTTSGAYSLDSQPYSLPHDQQQQQEQYQQLGQPDYQKEYYQLLSLYKKEKAYHEKTVSQLALNNEEIKTELGIVNDNLNQLAQENEQLYQTIQEKDKIQAEMNKQLEIVTKTANALYLKIREFKCRYYENYQKQSAWNSGNDAAVQHET